MIDTRRERMAASDDDLADGLASMVRGEDDVDARAASLLLAETVRWWRALMRPRLRITSAPGAPDAEASEAAYRARTAGGRR